MMTRTRLFTIWALLFVVVTVYAQQLIGRAPSQVTVGELFYLTYTVNTQNISSFREGKIPDGIDVKYTAQSEEEGIQFVNGNTRIVSSITFTYTLCATKNGTYTISPAQATVGGKTIKSNPLTIRVSGQSQQGQQSGPSRQQGRADDRQIQSAGSAISNSDLFIKVSANKQRVHEQEPILLTYKVYTRVELTQLEGKMPDLKGFHTQEVQLPQMKSYKVENINGYPYRTVTWSQFVMFPQITGKLEIPSITFNGLVRQQVRSIDWREALLNGGSSYVEVKKPIKAPGLTVQVDPLPARPANFSGGVGSFDISAQLDKTEVKANDPITLRVIVEGKGNMKLMKEPVVDFPKDFDRYDSKVNDKTKLTVNGVEGKMIYDFLAVPRHHGVYEIPPVEFTYYDTSSNSYKTVKTQSFTLDVTKASGKEGIVHDYTGQEDVKQLTKDIRYIKTGDADIQEFGHFFFNSTSYWVSLIALVLLFISLIVIFRKRALENADITKRRANRANKIATKRLHKGKQLMLANKTSEFYDEVLRALWGYVGDKLNMPVEQLSRENISQKLSERFVNQETVDQFIGALDECEFERYAPGDAKGNMKKTFDAAMTAIMKIENDMRRKTKGGTATALALLLFLLPLSAQGITKEDADSAYVRQQYQQAIKNYEELLQKGESADLYYNLGNAYYRVDNITRAVLNYERALLLSPGDRDIRFNLQMARSKTVDKIIPESEMFFVTWYRSLVNLSSVDGWAKLSLLALSLAIVLALVYLFSMRIWLRKIGFFGGLAFVIMFLLGNLFAYQQKQQLIERTGAIIVSSPVPVKSTPAKNGTNLFLLHEGTKVKISDGTMKDWKRVVVADGKEGWVEASQIEII